MRYIHPFVFILVRIIIGVPLSVKFMYDMFSLLSSGSAKNPPLVYFFVAVNLAINVLNVYWAMGMALGIHRGMKPPCSVDCSSEEDSTEKKVNFFDLSFTISFGNREHKRSKKHRKSNPAYDNTSPTFSLPVAIVALCSFLAKIITDKEAMLSLKDDARVVADLFKVPALMAAATYVIFKLFSLFGAKVFDEAKYGIANDHLYTRIRGQTVVRPCNISAPGRPGCLKPCEGSRWNRTL